MLLDTESVDHIGKHVYTIQVSGGRGGHSGVDIDKNPCNAVGVVSIAASRLFLHTIRDAELIGFDSGIDSSRTKIPSEASIKFITSLDPETTKSHFKEIEE
ncbi:MAG: hypothetical protein MJ233_01650 [Mycoplasmoidaceae bacterium]|nr:hypothetical protein [Mycoplasmoidaceae bacterium]